MGTFKNGMRVALIITALTGMTFGHLPSLNDASLKMGVTGTGGRGRATYTNRGVWTSTEKYRGDYKNSQGDTVSYGTFNNKTLWWWAKFAADSTKVPGKFGSGGDTSPWVLINSLSAAQNNGQSTFQATTWNTGLNNLPAGQAAVPTWRDGATGAYSFTHDDIGAMPFDLAVQPGWDVAKNHPDIKQCWGVYVEKMEEYDWGKAREMITEGHEMFNHSMRHTSAADQWQWFYPDKKVPTHDPAIPAAIRGLTVAGVWKVKGRGADYLVGNSNSSAFDFDFTAKPSGTIDTAANANQGKFQIPMVLANSSGEWENSGNPTAVFYNDYIEMTVPVFWDGVSPSNTHGVVPAINVIDPTIAISGRIAFSSTINTLNPALTGPIPL